MEAKKLGNSLVLTESLFKDHGVEVLNSLSIFSFIAKKTSLGIFLIF